MQKQYTNGILGAAMLGLSASVSASDNFNPTREEMEAFLYGSTAHTPAESLTIVQEFNRHIRDSYNTKGTKVFLFDREVALRNIPSSDEEVETEALREEVEKQLAIYSAVISDKSYIESKDQVELWRQKNPEGAEYIASFVTNKEAPAAQLMGPESCVISPGYFRGDQDARRFTMKKEDMYSFRMEGLPTEFLQNQSINIHEYVHCMDKMQYSDTTYEQNLTESVGDTGLALEIIHSGGTREHVESLMLYRAQTAVTSTHLSHFTVPTLQKLLDKVDVEEIRAMELDELADFAIKFVREDGNHLSEEQLSDMQELLISGMENDDLLINSLRKSAYNVGMRTKKNAPIPATITAKQVQELVTSGNHNLSENQIDFLDRYYLPYADRMHTAVDYEQGLTDDAVSKQLYEEVLAKGTAVNNEYEPFKPRPVLQVTPASEKAFNQLHNMILEDIYPKDEEGKVVRKDIASREYRLGQWERVFDNPHYEMPEHLSRDDLPKIIEKHGEYIEILKAKELKMYQASEERMVEMYGDDYDPVYR